MPGFCRCRQKYSRGNPYRFPNPGRRRRYSYGCRRSSRNERAPFTGVAFSKTQRNGIQNIHRSPRQLNAAKIEQIENSSIASQCKSRRYRDPRRVAHSSNKLSLCCAWRGILWRYPENETRQPEGCRSQRVKSLRQIGARFVQYLRRPSEFSSSSICQAQSEVTSTGA